MDFRCRCLTREIYVNLEAKSDYSQRIYCLISYKNNSKFRLSSLEKDLRSAFRKVTAPPKLGAFHQFDAAAGTGGD